MRNGLTYRAARKALAAETGEDMEPMQTKIGPGRRNKWLMRHPKLAPFYNMALSVLGGRPSWRAIRKMMVVLATAPRIPIRPGGEAFPVPLLQARHERPSWRSYPRQVIDANLRVAP